MFRLVNKLNMTDFKITSNLKRQSQEDSSSPNKCYKPEPQTELTETKELKDNIDCLEAVFLKDYLSPMDLLNIAISDENLKQTAERVYMSKFGKMLVKINCENKWVQLFADGKKSRAPIENCDHVIEYNKRSTAEIHWKYCLTFLRHFGHLISKLEISYWGKKPLINLKFAAHLDQYVNEYCAESLTEISFDECETEMMQNLKKPFTKVESIRFECCNLGNELSSINEWFPHVRHLDFFKENRSVNHRRIEVHLPHLISLTMYLPAREEENRI